MIIDAMTTAHRNEYFRNLLEHQRLTLESVTKQRDRLAEEIENLKAQLTRTQGAVTISRNGYVQELEQQRDTALFDLEFRRDLFKLQEQQLNDARRERDEFRGLLIELYNDINVIHSGKAVSKLSRLMRDENYN